jgi:hypothetical protein
MSVADMTRQSTAIVRGRLSGTGVGAQRGSVIYTAYRLQVSEVLKGSVGSTAEVFVPGGSFGGYRQSFAGSPVLEPGVDYVVFLWTSPKGVTQVIGLGQGVFEVKLSASGEAVLTRGPVDAQFVDATGRPVEDAGMKLTLGGLKQAVASQQREAR